MSPSATFLHTRSQRVEEGGRLRAVAFESTFETRGLINEQVIYEVRLYTVGRRPIQSRSRRFELPSGIVGGARDVMVVRPSQVFEGVRVTIPVAHLDIDDDDLPVVAEVGLYRASGERLAIRQCSVPIADLSEVRPPMDSPPPDERSFWFVAGMGTWQGILFGPYDSEEQAAQEAVLTGDSPRRIGATDYVWVIPYGHKKDRKREEWVGPCGSRKDAQKVAKLLAESLAADKGWEVRPPVMVRLATWLDQQERQHTVKRP
jgi:hypothetical protein